MAIHVLEEAQRCLNCKVPLCQKGCPIHTPIPKVIRMMLDGDLDKAGWTLFENNPLTTVCSVVCNHEKQCEGNCVLGRKGAPVHFSSIENYISTTYSNKMVKGPAEPNGMRVAIVGSGPAGLTIAVVLARKGYQVTIFEGKDKIGGVLRYGIPAFRLPKDVLDDFEYRHLVLKDIKIRPNTTIGGAITIEDLFRDGYKAIFLGTGVWQPNALHIKGGNAGQRALRHQLFKQPRFLPPGRYADRHRRGQRRDGRVPHGNPQGRQEGQVLLDHKEGRRQQARV